MAAKIYHLSNGVPVVIDRMPHTKSAAAGMYFMVGSRFEDGTNNGAAHFLEHMAFQGTATRTALDLALETANMGADSNAFTGREATCYHMSGLGRDAVSFVHILGDIVCNSTLPAAELETERGAIIEEINMYDDDPGSCAMDLVSQIAYPAQPYGATVLGPKENIEKFDRAVLQSFRDNHYHGGNLVVSVAGNVDTAAVIKELETSVGKLAFNPRSTFQPAVSSSGYAHLQKPVNQVQLAMTFNACATTDKKAIATTLTADILGGGMASRLFREIRDKRGLVYGVGAGYMAGHDAGRILVSAGTSPEKMKILMPVLCDELNKIRKSGVSDEELNRAKAARLVAHATNADSAEHRMLAGATDYHYKGRLVSSRQKEARINAVTTADIQAVANAVFSNAPALVTVGPPIVMERYSEIVQKLTL